MASEILKHVSVPTLDRPFGVHLWPLFDQAYEKVMGYPASEFNFTEGVTPLSTLKETTMMLITYYIIIFGGREVMKKLPAFKLNTLFMIHNLLLTTVSGILLVLFIEQLLPTLWRHGVFYAICDQQGGWTRPLIILYYVSCEALEPLEGEKLTQISISSTTSTNTSSSLIPSSWSSRRSH